MNGVYSYSGKTAQHRRERTTGDVRCGAKDDGGIAPRAGDALEGVSLNRSVGS
jgi:hypothetical protein